MTVAWCSYFPVEWLPDAPEEVKRLPKLHPATWQRVLLAELEKIPSLKLHILVLRRQFQRSMSFERRGVTFHLIKTPPCTRAPSFFWVDTLLLRRALREIRPDLLHAWGTENGAAMVAARLGYPSLVTMQGLISWLGELFPLGPYLRFAAMVERRSLRLAHTVTAESAFAVRYLREHYPHLKICQIEHAPQPCFAQIERRPQLRPPRFVFLSSLNHAKGGDLFVRAMESLLGELDFEATVIGGVDEALKRTLVATTPPALWQRIHFKHNLTSDQVAAELATATMMVYTTRGDNSPNAVKESVAAGVPVVAADIGGIPDYVFPGRNGLLFRCGDAAACATAVREACAHPLFGQGRVDPDTLAATRTYLSPELMGQNFFEAYRAVCGQSA
jgi:glycosyltransferase involved in cell wall biosynthesis